MSRSSDVSCHPTLASPLPELLNICVQCTLSGLSFLPADLQLLDDYLPLLLVVDSHGPGRVQKPRYSLDVVFFEIVEINLILVRFRGHRDSLANMQIEK